MALEGKNEKLNRELEELLRQEEGLKEGEALVMRDFCDQLKVLFEHGFSQKMALGEAEKKLLEINEPALQPPLSALQSLLEHYRDFKPWGFSPDLTLRGAIDNLELNFVARQNPETYERVKEIIAEAATADHLEELAHALEELYKAYGITPQTTLSEAHERLSTTLSDFDLEDKIKNAKEFSEAKTAIKELLHAENGPIEITPATKLEAAVKKLFDMALWLRGRHMEKQVDEL